MWCSARESGWVPPMRKGAGAPAAQGFRLLFLLVIGWWRAGLAGESSRFLMNLQSRSTPVLIRCQPSRRGRGGLAAARSYGSGPASAELAAQLPIGSDGCGAAAGRSRAGAAGGRCGWSWGERGGMGEGEDVASFQDSTAAVGGGAPVGPGTARSQSGKGFSLPYTWLAPTFVQADLPDISPRLRKAFLILPHFLIHF